MLFEIYYAVLQTPFFVWNSDKNLNSKKTSKSTICKNSFQKRNIFKLNAVSFIRMNKLIVSYSIGPTLCAWSIHFSLKKTKFKSR